MDLRLNRSRLSDDTVAATTFGHHGETVSSTRVVRPPRPKRRYLDFLPKPKYYSEGAEGVVIFGDQRSRRARTEPDEPLDLTVKKKRPYKRKLPSSSTAVSPEEDQEKEEEEVTVLSAKRKRESVICFATADDPISDHAVSSTESRDEVLKPPLGPYSSSVVLDGPPPRPKLRGREAYYGPIMARTRPRRSPPYCHCRCLQKGESSIGEEVDKHFIRSLGLETWMKVKGLYRL